jgi:polysaccharide export outer membrane protein
VDKLFLFATVLLGATYCYPAEEVPSQPEPRGSKAGGVQVQEETYVLGPGDQLSIWALGVEEVGKSPVRIDPSGYVDLPLIGRVRAGGLTVQQFNANLGEKLRTYVQTPQVAVTVTESRSQPVSVIGAVNKPGIHQLEGRKTLVDVIALAGGVKPEAGHLIRVTRRVERGAIPLPSAHTDPSGRFSVVELNLSSVLESRNPELNITIEPHDVIAVTKGELVYVLGQVRKSGGFVLNDRQNITALQALAYAEGLDRTAAPKQAKILRIQPGETQRTEIAVNLREILDGKSQDVPMQADDILFVPNNSARQVGMAALSTLVQVGTGLIIWRR